MKESMCRTLIDNIGEGVYFVDVNRKITLWNKGAETITGFTAREVVGSSCADNILVHIDSKGTPLCQDGCPLLDTIQKSEERDADVFLHHNDGHRIPVHVHASPIIDEQGNCIGAIEVFRDNTVHMNELRLIEEQKTASLIDPLTELPNRRFIEMKLAAVFDEWHRYGIPFGVLFADVDRFKTINDTYGHETGDRVLKMIARTIKANIRTTDSFGRWGGEEFLGIAGHVSSNDLVSLTEKLRLLVENSFIIHDEEKIQATITIGVTMAREDDTIQSVLNRADHLLYTGKECGRNCVKEG